MPLQSTLLHRLLVQIILTSQMPLHHCKNYIIYNLYNCNCCISGWNWSRVLVLWVWLLTYRHFLTQLCNIIRHWWWYNIFICIFLYFQAASSVTWKQRYEREPAWSSRQGTRLETSRLWILVPFGMKVIWVTWPFILSQPRRSGLANKLAS